MERWWERGDGWYAREAWVFFHSILFTDWGFRHQCILIALHILNANTIVYTFWKSRQICWTFLLLLLFHLFLVFASVLNLTMFSYYCFYLYCFKNRMFSFLEWFDLLKEVVHYFHRTICHCLYRQREVIMFRTHSGVWTLIQG